MPDDTIKETKVTAYSKMAWLCCHFMGIWVDPIVIYITELFCDVDWKDEIKRCYESECVHPEDSIGLVFGNS